MTGDEGVVVGNSVVVEVVVDTVEVEGVVGAEGVASIEVEAVVVAVVAARSARVGLAADSCSIVVSAAAGSCRD